MVNRSTTSLFQKGHKTLGLKGVERPQTWALKEQVLDTVVCAGSRDGVIGGSENLKTLIRNKPIGEIYREIADNRGGRKTGEKIIKSFIERGDWNLSLIYKSIFITGIRDPNGPADNISLRIMSLIKRLVGEDCLLHNQGTCSCRKGGIEGLLPVYHLDGTLVVEG